MTAPAQSPAVTAVSGWSEAVDQVRARTAETERTLLKPLTLLKLRSPQELLCRQGPAQLGPQSQSLFRSYGSSLPTSLTYVCLTLQRLRTLDTGCGYRVRSVPNLSGVSAYYKSNPLDHVFTDRQEHRDAHDSRGALPHGAPFRQPNCFQGWSRALSRKENSSSGICRRMWPGSACTDH